MHIHDHPFKWVTFLAILLSSLQGECQYKAALKTYTIQATYGLHGIGYERALNSHLSMDLSVHAGNYVKTRLNRYEYYRVSGVGGIGAFRYYPFTKKNVFSPRGFFVYTAGRYAKLWGFYQNTSSGDYYKAKGRMVNAGLGVGYKFTYRRVGLEGFVGWGVVGNLSINEDINKNKLRGSMGEHVRFPQLDLAICYMLSPS